MMRIRRKWKLPTSKSLLRRSHQPQVLSPASTILRAKGFCERARTLLAHKGQRGVGRAAGKPGDEGLFYRRDASRACTRKSQELECDLRDGMSREEKRHVLPFNEGITTRKLQVEMPDTKAASRYVRWIVMQNCCQADVAVDGFTLRGRNRTVPL